MKQHENETIEDRELSKPFFVESLSGLPFQERDAKGSIQNKFLKIIFRKSFEVPVTFDGVNSSGEVVIKHNLNKLTIPKARVIFPGFGTEGAVSDLPDSDNTVTSRFTFSHLDKNSITIKLYFGGQNVDVIARGNLYLQEIPN